MKKFRIGYLTLLMVFILALLTAFSKFYNSPVKGSVDPSDAALRAWLFSTTDTVNASVIQGNFQINDVKPGNYSLMVEGRPPYRNSIKGNIIVAEGQPTDVGVIQMIQ